MRDMDWKPREEIDVVYHRDPRSCVKVDGVPYIKAYVVGHGDAKMMESARSWAGEQWGGDPTQTKVVTTQNDGFAIRIAEAPGDSSNSGKLSFWMCVVEKDGVEPFAVGINSELLCLLIRQSTLVNGALQGEKVFFARCNGQLGVLHEHMDAYREYKEAIGRRQSMAKGKTTKWLPGNVYSTLRRRDVMMGEFVIPLRYDQPSYMNYEYRLDFASAPMKVFGPDQAGERSYVCEAVIENGNGPDELDDFEACLARGINDPHDRCPSRHCDGPAPFAASDHEQKVVEALAKICGLARDRMAGRRSRYENSWGMLATYHLMLCEASLGLGLKALDELDAAMATVPEKRPRLWDGVPRYALVHDGVTERFGSEIAAVRRVVELARAHYGG